MNLSLHFRIVCFADYVEELGHPYMWVQNLGGLHFPSDASEVRINIKQGLSQQSTVSLRYSCIMLACFFFPRVYVWAAH